MNTLKNTLDRADLHPSRTFQARVDGALARLPRRSGRGKAPFFRRRGPLIALACLLILAVALPVTLNRLRQSEMDKILPPGVYTAMTAGDPEPEADAEGTMSITAETEPPALEPDDVVAVDDLSARADLPQAWRNILLLGTDSRDMTKIGRSDTIIITSVNVGTGEIKFTSVMRDAVVELPRHGAQKINSATYFGGVELMMKTLNENLGMNITEFAVVNFEGLARMIDALGGIEADVTQAEMDVINRHIGEIAQFTMDQQAYLDNKAKLQLQSFGKSTLLTGIQAVTYARIRELDNDYARTDRQKAVLSGMFARVKRASLSQLMQMAASCWGQIATNVSMPDAVNLAQSALKGDGQIGSTKLPAKGTYTLEDRAGGSALWDVDYPENTQLLHAFIYGSRAP